MDENHARRFDRVEHECDPSGVYVSLGDRGGIELHFGAEYLADENCISFEFEADVALQLAQAMAQCAFHLKMQNQITLKAAEIAARNMRPEDIIGDVKP